MQNLRTPKVLLDRWLGGPSPAGQAAQNITSAPLQEIVWSARSHDDHDDDHNLLIVTRIISLRMTSRPNHPDNLQPSWRSKRAWNWHFLAKKTDFSGFVPSSGIGGYPPPLNGKSLCPKKLSGMGGPPPLTEKNPLSSFWQVPLNCDDHFATKPDFRGNSSKKLFQVYLLVFF